MDVIAYPFKKPADSAWLNGGGETEETPICAQCGERRESCENCSGKNDGE